MSGTTTNDFSTGNDVNLVLVLDTLGRIDLTYVVDFSAKQVVKSLRVDRLNDTPLGQDIPAGWNGTFTVDRGNSTQDDLAASLETLYWNNAPLPKGQIYQYISEPDGSQSTYLFSDVTINLSDAGTWTQNQQVKQTLSFFAGRRRRI